MWEWVDVVRVERGNTTECMPQVYHDLLEATLSSQPREAREAAGDTLDATAVVALAVVAFAVVALATVACE